MLWRVHSGEVPDEERVSSGDESVRSERSHRLSMKRLARFIVALAVMSIASWYVVSLWAPALRGQSPWLVGFLVVIAVLAAVDGVVSLWALAREPFDD